MIQSASIERKLQKASHAKCLGEKKGQDGEQFFPSLCNPVKKTLRFFL